MGTYIAHQRRLNSPTTLDHILSFKCCLYIMPCFHYDPSTFIATANAYNIQTDQILHGYESSISTMKSKQEIELDNFINTAVTKLTTLANLSLSKFSTDKLKNLENNHLNLLESTKSDTVQKAVETIKEIKKDKTNRQQEAT